MGLLALLNTLYNSVCVCVYVHVYMCLGVSSLATTVQITCVYSLLAHKCTVSGFKLLRWTSHMACEQV